MWAEGRPFFPGGRSANDTGEEAQGSAHHSVEHGPTWGKPRRDVAGRDAVDRTIDGGKQERAVKADHGIAPRREDVRKVEQLVRAKRERNAYEHACEHGANASKNAACLLCVAHDSLSRISVTRNSGEGRWVGGDD